jgi:hypothetical protein
MHHCLVIHVGKLAHSIDEDVCDALDKVVVSLEALAMQQPWWQQNQD